MKIFYPTAFATLLSLSHVDARGLRWGGGGGMGHHGSGRPAGMMGSIAQGGDGDDASQGGYGGNMMHGRPFVQSMIEEECTPDFDCSEFDEEAECHADVLGPPSFASGGTPTTEEELETAPLTEENETVLSEARAKRHGHVVRCACCSDKSFEELMGMGDNSSYGGLGHGMHHGGGGGRPFVQTLVEDECEAREFDCNEEIDCENIEMPEPPSFVAEMTAEEKEAAWSEAEATRNKILQCACCTDKSIQELIPEGSSRPFGGGGHHGMMSSSFDGSESSMMGSGRPGKMQGHMHGHGGGGHMMQHMMNFINNNCPKHSCPGDTDSASCILLESTATRAERRENALNCVCCRDDGVSELQENNSEEEVSVFLSSLLANESVQVEAAASNPASHVSSMLAVSFAVVVGVAFAVF